MKTTIMIVDDNKEFLAETEKYFSSRPDSEVIATAADGAEALDILRTAEPDVLLLDLVMPNLDGFSVLEQMDKRGTRVIVVSALSQDTFIAKAMHLGADYYMMKPVSMANLAARVFDAPVKRREGAATAAAVKSKSMDEKITNVFITVGIPAHIKGYQFLREAVKMAIVNPDVINSITKRLYPDVAAKFSTSPSKVERAIRHAIEVAWNRGKIENINSLFGVRVYSQHEKPTNGEFIALVADKMLLESV